MFFRTTLCPGGRYASCKTAEPLFNELKEKILPRAEKAAEDPKCASFYRAAAQWLSSEALFSPHFERYNDLLLDYLLQMIVSGDSHAWIELVDLASIAEHAQTEANVLCACNRSTRLQSRLLAEFRFVLHAYARKRANFCRRNTTRTVAKCCGIVRAAERIARQQCGGIPTRSNTPKLTCKCCANARRVPKFGARLRSFQFARRRIVSYSKVS